MTVIYNWKGKNIAEHLHKIVFNMQIVTDVNRIQIFEKFFVGFDYHWELVQ